MHVDVFKFVISHIFLQNSRSIEGHRFYISHVYLLVIIYFPVIPKIIKSVDWFLYASIFICLVHSGCPSSLETDIYICYIANKMLKSFHLFEILGVSYASIDHLYVLVKIFLLLVCTFCIAYRAGVAVGYTCLSVLIYLTFLWAACECKSYCVCNC